MPFILNMKNKILHIILAIFLVVLLVLLSDPFMIWMPMGAQMIALACIASLVAIWAGLVMYEKTNDEREVIHKMYAGRVSYISGIVVLTTAVVYQGLKGDIDPWISVALAVMVLSKLISRLHSEYYK